MKDRLTINQSTATEFSQWQTEKVTMLVRAMQIFFFNTGGRFTDINTSSLLCCLFFVVQVFFRLTMIV